MGSPYQEAGQGSVRTEAAGGKFRTYFKGRQQDLPINPMWPSPETWLQRPKVLSSDKVPKVSAGPGGPGKAKRARGAGERVMVGARMLGGAGTRARTRRQRAQPSVRKSYRPLLRPWAPS